MLKKATPGERIKSFKKEKGEVDWIHYNENQGHTKKNKTPEKSKKLRNFIIAIVIFFIIGIIAEESGSSSNSSTSYSDSDYSSPNSISSDSQPSNIHSNTEISKPKTNNDEIAVGQYICSSYHASAAEKIEPSSYTAGLINSEQAEIDRLEREIENTYVDEYSEYSVNSYNAKINTYKGKINSLNAKVESYNRDVDAYNSYLVRNCRKNY